MAFDDSEAPPLVFANQVIQMFAEHLLGGSAQLEAADFGLIRVVFRRLGGSWFELCQGSPKHTSLLIEAVKAWGAKDR